MQNEYDAIATAKNLDKHLRMLFIQGGHDYQVTETDFNLWKSALGASHPQATFHYLPTLDHLMRSLPQLAVPASYLQPGSVDEQVITLIGNFVKQ